MIRLCDSLGLFVNLTLDGVNYTSDHCNFQIFEEGGFYYVVESNQLLTDQNIWLGNEDWKFTITAFSEDASVINETFDTFSGAMNPDYQNNSGLTFACGNPCNDLSFMLSVAPIDGIEGFYEGSFEGCLLYTSPSPRDQRGSRMPSSA